MSTDAAAAAAPANNTTDGSKSVEEKNEPMEVEEEETEEAGDLKVLLGLGFPRQACVDALAAANGKPDQAVEILLSSRYPGPGARG